MGARGGRGERGAQGFRSRPGGFLGKGLYQTGRNTHDERSCLLFAVCCLKKKFFNCFLLSFVWHHNLFLARELGLGKDDTFFYFFFLPHLVFVLFHVKEDKGKEKRLAGANICYMLCVYI